MFEYNPWLNEQTRPNVAFDDATLQQVRSEWQSVLTITGGVVRDHTDSLPHPISTLVVGPMSETTARHMMTHVANNGAPEIFDQHPILTSYMSIPPVPEEMFDHRLKDWGNTHLSMPEARFVHHRYEMGRQALLISLGAIMCSNTIEAHGLNISPPGQELRSLLNPVHWQNLRAITSRVYSFEAQGQQYILKEERSNRHFGLVSDDKDLIPNTVAEEYALAKEKKEKVNLDHPDVELEYEDPLGYVEYSNGYGFSVYNFMPEDSSGNVQSRLEQGILERKRTYRTEWKHLAHKVDTALGHTPGTFSRKSILSFEDFAKAKAAFMASSATCFASRAQIEAGFGEQDIKKDQYSLSFVERGDRVKVHLAVYDSEFTYRLDSEAKRKMAIASHHMAFTAERDSHVGAMNRPTRPNPVGIAFKLLWDEVPLEAPQS